MEPTSGLCKPNGDIHILLADCDDQKGIVHKITGILFSHGLNVDDQAEFVEKGTNRFFLRTEVSGAVNKQLVQQEIAALGLHNLQLSFSKKEKKEIVIFAGKEAHCLGDLLIRHAYGELNAKVAAVISNHGALEKLVRSFDIPYFHVPHEGLERESHEARISAVLESCSPAYLVLAKYMRILSPDFVRRFRHRIINIHHSFLPAFSGAKPYHQAFARGVKIIGATAHSVNEQLDEGPIIAQDVIPTTHNKTPAEMMRAGRDVEKVVLAKALRLVLEDRVFVHAGKTIVFD